MSKVSEKLNVRIDKHNVYDSINRLKTKSKWDIESLLLFYECEMSNLFAQHSMIHYSLGDIRKYPLAKNQECKFIPKEERGYSNDF